MIVSDKSKEEILKVIKRAVDYARDAQMTEDMCEGGLEVFNELAGLIGESSSDKFKKGECVNIKELTSDDMDDVIYLLDDCDEPCLYRSSANDIIDLSNGYLHDVGSDDFCVRKVSQDRFNDAVRDNL